MTALTHTVRNSLIDKERTFTLGADALCWRDKNGGDRIPYADVREMRLIGYTSLIGEAFQCTVRARNGDVAKLRSAHYRSLANFEDRTDTYALFISALSKRVAEYAPGAKLIAGSNTLWIVWLVIGVLCAIVVALTILSLFEGAPPAAGGIVAIAICVAAVPIAIHRLRQDRARRFDPNAPPAELIRAMKPHEV